MSGDSGTEGRRGLRTSTASNVRPAEIDAGSIPGVTSRMPSSGMYGSVGAWVGNLPGLPGNDPTPIDPSQT